MPFSFLPLDFQCPCCMHLEGLLDVQSQFITKKGLHTKGSQRMGTALHCKRFRKATRKTTQSVEMPCFLSLFWRALRSELREETGIQDWDMGRTFLSKHPLKCFHFLFSNAFPLSLFLGKTRILPHRFLCRENQKYFHCSSRLPDGSILSLTETNTTCNGSLEIPMRRICRNRILSSGNVYFVNPYILPPLPMGFKHVFLVFKT